MKIRILVSFVLLLILGSGSLAFARYSDDAVAEEIFCTGTKLMEAGQYKEAIPHLEDAIKRDPHFVAAFVNLALSYNAIGDFKKGYSVSSKAIEFYRGSSYLYNHRAAALVGLHRYPEAISDYQAALRLDPESIHQAIRVAGCYRDIGAEAKAKEAYGLVSKMKAKTAFDFFNRGLAKYHLCQYEASIADFSSCENMDLRDTEAHYHHGLALVNLGRFKQAVAEYNTVLERSPKAAQTFYTRGVAQLLAGNYAGSVSDFKMNVLLTKWKDSHAPYSAVFGSLACRKLGKMDDAARFLSDAGNNLKSTDWPAPIISYLQRKSSAEVLLTTAKTNDLKTEALTIIGVDLALSGKVKSATESLRWVKTNGNKTFSEYQLASVELAKLGR